MSYEMLHGDCLTELPKLIERDVRVSLVNADIPYFKVKADEWDRQWKDEAAFLAWVGEVCTLVAQIMQPNGSLYLYASPQMARKVGGVVAEHFQILTDVRWRKPLYSTKAEMFRKEDLRAYFPASESIFFCEPHGADKPYGEALIDGNQTYWSACEASKRGIFGDYLRAEFDRACVTNKQIAALFPSKTGGMTGCVSNWLLGYNCPTAEQYEAMRAYLGEGFLGRDYEALRRDYEALRRDYEALRRDYDSLRAEHKHLRRPFTVSPDVPYTDIWDFPTVLDYPGKHPCEKPYAMMEHIVRASSREGDLALDLCAGSGVFGEAALANGRDVIAIERDAHWARKAANRAGRVRGQRVNLPTPPRNPIDTPLFNTESAA